MSYKRLHTRLKNNAQGNLDSIANAFESEGRVVNPVFKPVVHQPESDYSQEIEQIRQTDAKLGLTFQRLNIHQRHAVFHHAQNSILAAMVGSGKTTVLIAKIFYLHFMLKVPFDEMVVLTFTNKAAREIKERIAAFLENIDEDLNRQLRYFGTFHSVARQILEEHQELSSLGYKSGFMILDEQEKQEFLERIIIQEGFNIKYQSHLVKRLKNYKETGAVLMGNMKQEDDLEKLIPLIEKEKQAVNSMDFDDLLEYSNRLLKHHIHKSPQWIIVDEFQDCNNIQLDFIENLKDTDSNIFVVGDPNQSIYGWRGSKEHIFREVQPLWDATWMELPQNYRSTENILSAAESLLADESSSLIPTRTGGKPILLVRHFDDQQEAYYLREQMHRLQNEGVELDSVAILFRTHEQIKLVETVFSQDKIPFQLGKKIDLYNDVALSFILRVFKLCCNHNDIDSALNIICDKTFGVVKRTPKLIKELRERDSKLSILKALIIYLEKGKKQHPETIYLLKQIENFGEQFLGNVEATAKDLMQYLNLQNILKPTSIHYADYIKSIEAAWMELSTYVNGKGWGKRQDIFKVAIDQVILEGTFQINNRIKEKGSGVHLLTIHAAKGLEFDKVYIAGANSGIIPLTQHKGSQNLKEEKRLLFVALTRGKNNVEIGWHVQPSFRNANPEPSYFLNAIPDNLLERSVAGALNDTKVEKVSSEEWTLNDKVKHKKYGVGFVTVIDDVNIICAFDTVGEKSFSKVFAKALVTKIE